MIDKRIVESALIKQRKHTRKLLSVDLKQRFIARHISLDNQILAITGLRSVGKTTLALDVLGKSKETYAYIDLSETIFFNLTEESISAISEIIFKLYQEYNWIIIDNFTDNNHWKKCVKFFRDKGKSIILVGSGNLEETLFDFPINNYYLYPLSFSEYCHWHNIKTTPETEEELSTVRTSFDDYLIRGGLPANQESARPNIATSKIIDKIFSNDLKGDFRKSNRDCIIAMGRFLIKNSPYNAFYNELSERFGISSENTAKKYAGILKETAIIYSLTRFAQHDKIRNYCEKLFSADHSFVKKTDTEGRLETIIYLQLRRFCERHGYRMHYYGNRDLECDFALCCNKRMRTIIQVMYDYSESTIVKEKVAGLISLSQATGCDRLFILTDNCHDVIEAKGLHIEVKPAYEFLLDRSHMIISKD